MTPGRAENSASFFYKETRVLHTNCLYSHTEVILTTLYKKNIEVCFCVLNNKITFSEILNSASRQEPSFLYLSTTSALWYLTRSSSAKRFFKNERCACLYHCYHVRDWMFYSFCTLFLRKNTKRCFLFIVIISHCNAAIWSLLITQFNNSCFLMHTYSGVATATFHFFFHCLNCDLLNSKGFCFGVGDVVWIRKLSTYNIRHGSLKYARAQF